MNHRHDTRKRILEAAAEVFGTQGFKAATVRQICERAGTNVASINYYFRDKEGLYLSVLEDLMVRGYENYPPDMGVGDDASPEKRLHAFIRSFLLRLLGCDSLSGPEGPRQLIVRELSDPSKALDWIVEAHVKPNKEVLMAIVSDLLGPDVQRETVGLCTISVIGQCLHYISARPILQRVATEFISAVDNVEKLAAHITAFSLGGIKDLKEQSRKDR